MKPISIKALATLLGFSHSNETLIEGVAIDSRHLQKGDLFFALPGERVQGSSFLKEAAMKGASCALVPSDYQGSDYGLPLLRVPNVLLALQEWARKKIIEMKIPILAITGSMGKTTTKEFAKTLLEGAYKVHASPLSYNSQRTLPLTILQAKGEEELLLLEMGMSEPGEMANLVSIAPPTIALITTVTLQHATLFPEGLSAIAEQKGAIFSHPKTQLALYPADIPSLASYAHSATKSFSATLPSADFFLEKRGDHFFIKEREERISCTLPIKTKAHLYNALAAIALVRSVGMEWNQILPRLPLLKAPPLRFEQVEREGILFINDAYNANPEALCAALSDLPQPKGKGRKIGVLGGMNALGRFSEEEHRKVAQAALPHLDFLLCVGKECEVMRSLWRGREFEWYETREALFARVREIARKEDVILLKGARAYRLEELLTLFLP